MKNYILFGIILLNLSVSFGEKILECYSCDSNEDTECATKPGPQINVEECPTINDECVTSIVAGITRRGCLSRLYPNNYCPAPCDKCSTSLCNRNIFPEDRLRCYQCLGSECINVEQKATLLLPCPVYAESDRCYTNIIGINNVQRGCEKTNLPATCPNTCFKCNYDGCNNQKGVYEDSCFECSHNTMSPNPLCLRSQQITKDNMACAVGEGLKKCSNKLLYGDKGKCYTYINEQTGVVQRGCSSTKGFFPTGNLTECYGDDCNHHCFDISCNTCDSKDTSTQCRNGINLRSNKCSQGTVSCFSCEGGAQLRRGCTDSNFTALANEACYQCFNADGCNRMSIRTCYRCSSLEVPECSSWLNLQKIKQSNCSNPNELCVSTIVQKLGLTYTLRGCASQVPECTDNDPFCVRCNGTLCNNQATSWPIKSSSNYNIVVV